MKTRMHSSRMRTARSLTVSYSIRWGREGLPLPMADPLADPLDADHPLPPPACGQTPVQNITFADFVFGR